MIKDLSSLARRSEPSVPSIAGVVSSSMHWLQLTLVATSATAVWSQPLAQGGSNPQEQQPQDSQVNSWQLPSWILPAFSAGALGFLGGRFIRPRGRRTPGGDSGSDGASSGNIADHSGSQQAWSPATTEAERKKYVNVIQKLRDKTPPKIWRESSGGVKPDNNFIEREWFRTWMEHCTAFVMLESEAYFHSAIAWCTQQYQAQMESNQDELPEMLTSAPTREETLKAHRVVNYKGADDTTAPSSGGTTDTARGAGDESRNSFSMISEGFKRYVVSPGEKRTGFGAGAGSVKRLPVLRKAF